MRRPVPLSPEQEQHKKDLENQAALQTLRNQCSTTNLSSHFKKKYRKEAGVVPSAPLEKGEHKIRWSMLRKDIDKDIDRLRNIQNTYIPRIENFDKDFEK